MIVFVADGVFRLSVCTKKEENKDMRVILYLVLSAIFTTSASAQWLYQEEKKSAFSDEIVHLLLTVKQGKALGVRCENGEIEIMLILNEKIEQIDTVNSLDPKLLIRIDGNRMHELSATAQNTTAKFVLYANADTALVEEIRDAKKRVAIVLDLAGNQFVETSYSVRGSTKAAKTLLRKCQPDS